MGHEETIFVIVEGEVSEATDYHDNPYINIEVENLSPLLCPIELIYKNNAWQTKLLRHFRDNVLSRTPEGRELIKLYYLWSPAMVKAMEGDEEFKEWVRESIEDILARIEMPQQ